jgi:hypothetical protein
MDGLIKKGRGGPHAIKVMAWVNPLASALWHRTHIFADIGVSGYFSGAPISTFFNTIRHKKTLGSVQGPDLRAPRATEIGFNPSRP